MPRAHQLAFGPATLALAAGWLAPALAATPAKLDYEAVAAAQVTPPDAAVPAAETGAPVGTPSAMPVGEPAPEPGTDAGTAALGEAGGQDAADIHDAAAKRHRYLTPYIEAQQVVDAELSPQSNIFTYTVLAAGIDGGIATHNTQASVSLRYEREIGEGNGSGSANVLSGVARASVGIIPGTLKLDAAGFATRTNVLSNGAALPGIDDNFSALTQIYSVVGGPTLNTHAGDVKLDAAYHVGYTHVGTPGLGVEAPVTTGTSLAFTPGADIVSHSTVQDARARAALRPGDALPVGIAIEGGYYQEDISDLAQRAKDAHVRGEVTIPVASDLALVGGVGYESVQVSSRNAVLDTNGNPVTDANGQLETDYAGPRYIAFDTSGLIWDVGAIWRPSDRTSLEAHVGRRYGDIGAYGLFSWHPSTRTALNVAVYNNLSGFGGQLDGSLLNLSSEFQSVRNALTGNITPCVASQQGGNCLTGALGTVRSTVYRSRGISATYNLDFGRTQAGIGAGYDRRTYIAAPGTVLAIENGEVDQYYWVTGYVTYAIDPRSSLTGTLNADWFRTGVALNGDVDAVGATAVYQRRITRHLSATAALGVDSINRQALADIWDATGSLAVRYSF